MIERFCVSTECGKDLSVPQTHTVAIKCAKGKGEKELR